ncbi:BLOC-1-related complex subunit 8 homolog isoform X1 [Hydra vulgaris]|uniref:BLOC-1-related complex subunit 8 homolog isoform X1 n=1 Tax=Hydra vulgaris TaxID=6087 RepID=UPI0002B470FB|nr:BLOC-1-related complex subunit 8 homolog [Hydra vulgaris]
MAVSNLTEIYMLKKNLLDSPNYSSTLQGFRHLDPEKDYKVRRITSLVNESIHIAANEPSLGLYRIQEHVKRTLPHLVKRKKELSSINTRIQDASYDLGLSLEVIESISQIKHFTRIKEALQNAISYKIKLNEYREQEKARQEFELKNARSVNKSISQNEPAEGFICPVCYFALLNQEELFKHWESNHNLDNCENDVFHELEVPVEDGNNFVLNQDNDMTVIEMGHSSVSECIDVVYELSGQK